MENKNMRKLNVTVQCMAVYNSSIMVPRELTFEEAIKYAKEHIDEINLGELEYISDSDELDERQAKQFWEELDNGKVLRIESCAEPGLTEPIACGCISDYDLNLLGFSEDAESNGAGYQRKGCMCYAGKTELLKHKTRCPHGCLYCYWKDIKG